MVDFASQSTGQNATSCGRCPGAICGAFVNLRRPQLLVESSRRERDGLFFDSGLNEGRPIEAGPRSKNLGPQNPGETFAVAPDQERPEQGHNDPGSDAGRIQQNVKGQNIKNDAAQDR